MDDNQNSANTESTSTASPATTSLKDRIANYAGSTHQTLETQSKAYAFISRAAHGEVTPTFDPNTTETGRMYVRHGTMALNYAGIPHAAESTDIAARLFARNVNDEEAAEIRQNFYNSVVRPEYLLDAVDEVQKRIDEVEETIAAVNTAIASFKKKPRDEEESERFGEQLSDEDQLAFDLVQAKNDFRLLSYNLTLIMQLAEQISNALPASKHGTSNAQQVLDCVFTIIDIMEQLLTFIEGLIDDMTIDEYQRVTALKAELDENKTKSSPKNAFIINNIMSTAFEILQPYITNLSLMLTMECFNAVLKILEKVPGVSDVIVPPLDMIPTMVTLLGMLVSGDIIGLKNRFIKDVKILYKFIVSSQVVSFASDADLKTAELNVLDKKIKEGKTEALEPNQIAKMRSTEVTVAKVLETQNQSNTMAAINAGNKLAMSNLEYSAAVEKEKQFTEYEERETLAQEEAEIHNDIGYAKRGATLATLMPNNVDVTGMNK